MAAIIRLKRKACYEPAEGLVIAFKKPKSDLTDVNEVLFKFAATLNSEKESVRDHVQAALSKEKTAKFTQWRDPKNTAVRESTVKKLSEKLKAEHKTANDKKKLDYLNNRRLILAEEFQDPEDSIRKDAEVRQLFHLYDIIEENEEVKKQNDEGPESMITCNNEPLIREKVADYVFDVYIAEGHIDHTFVDGTVSVRPCTLASEDIYSGDSDNSEECHDDEDDSNEENNWRNEYPEDESSSEKDTDDKDSDSECDAIAYGKVSNAFRDFDIDADDDFDDDDVEQEQNFDYSRFMKEQGWQVCDM